MAPAGAALDSPALRKRTLKDLVGNDGWIILKWTSRTQNMSVWTAFIQWQAVQYTITKLLKKTYCRELVYLIAPVS
jgi:hypothetical protein